MFNFRGTLTTTNSLRPARIFAFALCLLPACLAFGRPASIAAAAACAQKVESASQLTNCPYLPDVMKGDREFKAIFLKTLRTAKIPFISGPDSGLEAVSVGEQRYLTASRCQAHNCGDHYFRYLYSLDRKKLTGIYQTAPGKRRWFGLPSDAEQAKLLEIVGK